MLRTRDLRRTDGWKVRLTDVRMDGRTDKWTEQDPNNVYARSFIKQGCIFMKKIDRYSKHNTQKFFN